ncbi:Exonuclease SbcD [Edwardsiella anguillarum]|nr:Exonuclease SbcD [Edwardsiella anguillarum]BET83833.1 Exonuclease SbcD [Edwardsiella anguillarum]BET87200.1 Exonuclease SbcD [Edwardsiella anguillarum]BET90626.1 Exonuclease SbcD [Edwardsiella anguillarum]GAJ66614.1 exonuclease SbcD [Edwardsiella piscicida]
MVEPEAGLLQVVLKQRFDIVRPLGERWAGQLGHREAVVEIRQNTLRRGVLYQRSFADGQQTKGVRIVALAAHQAVLRAFVQAIRVRDQQRSALCLVDAALEIVVTGLMDDKGAFAARAQAM